MGLRLALLRLRHRSLLRCLCHSHDPTRAEVVAHIVSRWPHLAPTLGPVLLRMLDGECAFRCVAGAAEVAAAVRLGGAVPKLARLLGEPGETPDLVNDAARRALRAFARGEQGDPLAREALDRLEREVIEAFRDGYYLLDGAEEVEPGLWRCTPVVLASRHVPKPPEGFRLHLEGGRVQVEIRRSDDRALGNGPAMRSIGAPSHVGENPARAFVRGRAESRDFTYLAEAEGGTESLAAAGLPALATPHAQDTVRASRALVRLLTDNLIDAPDYTASVKAYYPSLVGHHDRDSAAHRIAPGDVLPFNRAGGSTAGGGSPVGAVVLGAAVGDGAFEATLHSAGPEEPGVGTVLGRHVRWGEADEVYRDMCEVLQLR